MKTKTLLSCYLVIHFISVLMINVYPFKSLKKEENVGGLTSIGDFFVHQLELPYPSATIASAVSWYTKLIGSNRGYEFFAPNVPKGNMKLTFVSNTGEELNMMHSIESETKVMTALSFLSSEIVKNESWKPLLRSICVRFLAKNTAIDEITVYANITKYKGRKEAETNSEPIQEKQLLFKIKRHEKNI